LQYLTKQGLKNVRGRRNYSRKYCFLLLLFTVLPYNVKVNGL
jgi:hypothetical protein